MHAEVKIDDTGSCSLTRAPNIRRSPSWMHVTFPTRCHLPPCSCCRWHLGAGAFAAEGDRTAGAASRIQLDTAVDRNAGDVVSGVSRTSRSRYQSILPPIRLRVTDRAVARDARAPRFRTPPDAPNLRRRSDSVHPCILCGDNGDAFAVTLTHACVLSPTLTPALVATAGVVTSTRTTRPATIINISASGPVRGSRVGAHRVAVWTWTPCGGRLLFVLPQSSYPRDRVACSAFGHPHAAGVSPAAPSTGCGGGCRDRSTRGFPAIMMTRDRNTAERAIGFYPPAIAPTTRKVQPPSRTASGSGALGSS